MTLINPIITVKNTVEAIAIPEARLENANQNKSEEAQLLSTTQCSPAFHNFASQLGQMIPTRHLRYYSAGLDVSEDESDGRYTLAWLADNDADAVLYHVAYLMPDGLNTRKRHFGNDNVLIVFVDNSGGYRPPILNNLHTKPLLSGHFNFATIFVKPLSAPGLFCVSCRLRTGLSAELETALMLFTGDNTVPEVSAGSFVRNLAMLIDVAIRSKVEGLGQPTNSLDRARIIEQMKRYEM